MMFRFIHQAIYHPGQITTQQIPSSLLHRPQVDQAIEQAWKIATSKPGVRLFNGPVCRFESFHTHPAGLLIHLSQTDYRTVVGTNFANPDFANTYGNQFMANPLGVSTGLITSDGYLMMGVRNQSVAYYPHRVHPFAGSIEAENQIDLFANVRRELREELGLVDTDIQNITCLGLAEDCRLMHPESIFMTWTFLTKTEIESKLDQDEHHDSWHVPSTSAAIQNALDTDNRLTPIAQALLTAWITCPLAKFPSSHQ